MSSSFIDAAHALLDAAPPINARINAAYTILGDDPPALADPSLLDAARAALVILSRAQLPDPIPTRNLALLRSLLSLLFQHGINPLLALNDPVALEPLLSSLFSTLFPCGLREQPVQTLITTLILHRHAADLLKASITLAWLPKSQWPQDSLFLHSLRPPVLRLLEFLPLSQIMSDLGAILSSSPPPPAHVRKLCSSLLTKTLLRPAGVRALFAAVFGEQGDADDLQLEKYERTAGILMAVPTGLKPEEYFQTIVPRLTELLSSSAPATFRRAASFSISRMLDSEFLHHALVSSALYPIIHHPFIHDSTADDPQAAQHTPVAALSILTVLLLNTDPSPILITRVLSPVLPALYALMYHLDNTKTFDPVLKESVRGLLATWGRVVETQNGVNTLWSVIQGETIQWVLDISGNIKRGSSDRPTKLTLFASDDIGRDEEMMGENFLDLYPDPEHFVRYVKSLDRLDMASELFVKLLEAYHLADTRQDTDPSRALLYLQMSVQMQTQLGDGSSPTNILRKPEHILSFVKHALGSQNTSSNKAQFKRSRGLGLKDLKITDDVEVFEDGDSDDEPMGPSSNKVENSMIDTAINLLLAILEANPNLSARNAPVLNDIFSFLEPLSDDASESIRSLAREARMVMTARLASSSTSWPAPPGRQEDDPREIYQRALKLLQDPILPIRAHGLSLLRQLVASRPHAAPKTDPALTPAIMAIFMQSVQDDDSYIFLNAVQGLSAMVDVFGKDVLRNLLETYTHNLSTSSVGILSRSEVDAKVRIGEALGQVIRRCGDVLGTYADIVVPRLIFVFRSSHIPTVLRTSAVSLLAECVKTSRLSVLGYIDDLAASMIDALEVEMVPITRSPPKDDDRDRGAQKAEEHKTTEAMDANPTAVDSKLAPLRRAALHFWTALLHQLTRATYDDEVVGRLPAALLRRGKAVLGYIASTDDDGLVRVMAREANEAIDQLNKATLGI